MTQVIGDLLSGRATSSYSAEMASFRDKVRDDVLGRSAGEEVWIPTNIDSDWPTPEEVEQMTSRLTEHQKGKHDQARHRPGGGGSAEALAKSAKSGVKSSTDIGERDSTFSLARPQALVLGDGTEAVSKLTEDVDHNDLDRAGAQKRFGGDGAFNQNAEVAAANLASAFGMEDVMPPTIKTKIDGKDVILQLKVEGLRNAAANAEGEIPLGGEPDFIMTQATPESLAKVAVLDSIMGNVDRHAGNVFYTEGDGGRYEMKALDQGIPLEYKIPGGILGSNEIRVLAHVGGKASRAGEKANAISERIIADLPDISFDKWDKMVRSDNTQMSKDFSRGSFWRYRQAKEKGFMPPPGDWTPPPRWNPGG